MQILQKATIVIPYTTRDENSVAHRSKLLCKCVYVHVCVCMCVCVHVCVPVCVCVRARVRV